MPREFTDTSGVRWRVSMVSASERKRTSGSFRRADLFRPADECECLWFESAQEVKRLSPVPMDWERTDALNLEYYCARAERVVARDTPGGASM